MLKSEAHQYSFMSTLYNKIPKNHILRAINSAISLSFINDYLKENENNPKAKETIKEAKEVLNSELFIEQKGIRSLIDKDARVGHKSKTESFFGYKAEYCLTTNSELITAILVKMQVCTINIVNLLKQMNLKKYIKCVQE